MIATGVPQLDTILGGGIVEHSALVLCGPPGSGKTVLASQIMAAAVDRGEPVLLVTAFSEPQSKLITHLRSFRFFRSEALGNSIKLLNLQHPLLTGLDTAADTLVRDAREHGARLVVLDELGGVLLGSPDPAATYGFLYNLSAKLSLLGITLIMTLDLAPGAELERPELVSIDTIIALSQEHAAGTVRTLRVIKHRGAEPLSGYHHFRIGDDGVRCFARLEALAQPGDVEVPEERAAFGIPALDAAMGGGPNQSTSTLLQGPASAVRPLGLRWLLYGLPSEQPGCLVSLREPARRLLRGTVATNQSLQRAASEGRLLLVPDNPAELLPDQLAHELLDALHSGMRWRVLIEGAGVVAPLLAADGRDWQFWAALLAGLRARGATTLLLDDRRREASAEGPTVLPNRPELGTLPDNLVQVRRRQMATYCSVLDMRFSAFNPQPVSIDG